MFTRAIGLNSHLFCVKRKQIYLEIVILSIFSRHIKSFLEKKKKKQVKLLQDNERTIWKECSIQLIFKIAYLFYFCFKII